MATRLTTLPNGFRVVTHHIPYVETISMGVWVQAGSRCETMENNGIAHFLEHMAFKGTHTRSAFDIVQEIESVGGDLNASTSQDVTCYHASLLKENTKLGIEILADILQNSLFSEEEIEKERNVVLQEIDQTNDNPEDVLFDQFQKTAFPKQSLGRPILGTRETVKSFNKKMLEDFIDQHYFPDKMVFSAAGNLNHDEIVSYIEASFVYPHGSKTKASQGASYKGGYSHDFKELEQQHFVMGFEGVSLKSPNFYVAHCYSGLLGGGMSSRLFQEIREKRGLVYSISSFVTAYQDTGLFGVYTSTSEDKTEEIMEIIAKEMKKSTGDITDEEVNRSKMQLRAHILMSQESTFYWASVLARQLLTFEKTIPMSEIMGKIDAVNKESLQQYAQTLLDSPLCLSFIGPRKKEVNESFLASL